MKNYRTDTKKDLDQNSNLLKINEVSDQLKLTPRAIRYYESEGLLGSIKRSIGYTRYFTLNDLERLKEIKKLKRDGKKISQIKEIFKKYSIKQQYTYDNIAIASTLIEKEDIAKCLSLGIEIIDVNLKMNQVLLNYVDWRSIPTKEYLNTCQIDPLNTSKKYTLSPIKSDHWVGNGMRSIIKELIAMNPEEQINEAYVKAQHKNITEWLILPLNIDTTYRYKDALPDIYLLEKKQQDTNEAIVVTLNQLFTELEKQIKTISASVSGLLKQVILHANQSHKDSKDIVSFLNKIIHNKQQLSIEDLSPIYIQSIGSDQAYLLSVYA